MNEPKIIKVKPWGGFNDEIYEGRKTKISLFENRLEYKFKFTQKVSISLMKGEEIVDTKEQDNFCDESGIIDKSAIYGFVEYIDTKYTPDTGVPIKTYMVDIAYGSTILPVSTETIEEQHMLFNELKSWKYGQ